MTRFLDSAIDRGIKAALDRCMAPGGIVEKAIDSAVLKVMRAEAMANKPVVGNLRSSAFIWQMAFEFMRTDLTMEFPAARDLAVDTLKDFLRDEGIKFGNRAYAWDQSAAKTLARECETEYWERAA